ncbi:MAG: phage holin family protein [Pseudomonadota bacterium]
MAGETPPEESLPSLVGRLVDDGEQFIRAELKLYRARLFARLNEVRSAIILGVGAIALTQAVLVAALVGLLLALLPLVGTPLAVLIVIVLGLAVAGVMGWLAWRLIVRATEIKDKDERP